DVQGVFSHCAECETCRLLATKQATSQARLASLRPADSAPRKADCPPEELWLSLTAGLLNAEQVAQGLLHAANCDHCGPILRTATLDIGNDLMPEEKSLVDSLISDGERGRRALAKRLSGLRHDESTSLAKRWWRVLIFRPRAAFIVTASILLLVVTS